MHLSFGILLQIRLLIHEGQTPPGPNRGAKSSWNDHEKGFHFWNILQCCMWSKCKSVYSINHKDNVCLHLRYQKLSTYSTKINRPGHNINCLAKTRIYLTPYVCTEQLLDIIFEKTLIEVGSSHLYASFGTFCVQIGQLVEVQWGFKLSEEFEIDIIFLRKQRFYRFPHFSKTHCTSTNWPIWTQKVPKEA